MKKLFMLGLLALTLVFGATVYAQDEAPGQQTSIKAIPLHYCASYPCPLAFAGTLKFSNVYTDAGGTFTLYLNQAQPQYNYLTFSGVSDFAATQITSVTYTQGGGTVNFTGITNDGDNGQFQGSLTFTYTLTGPYWSGGGIGNHGRYVYYDNLTSGTFTISYN